MTPPAGEEGAMGEIDALDHAAGLLMQLKRECERQHARAERLAGALEFYADPMTYFAIGFLPDSPTGDFMDDFEVTDLGYKPGKRARAALQDTPPAPPPTEEAR